MIEWFRWYHNTTSDPKLAAIARRARQPKTTIIAVWAALLEHASEAEPRGSLHDADPETIAVNLDIDEQEVSNIIAAMADKGMIDAEGVAAWDKRQVRRERLDDSKERVRAYRERKKRVTPSNATVTPGNATSRQVTPPEADTEADTDSETDGGVDKRILPSSVGGELAIADPAAADSDSSSDLLGDPAPATKPKRMNGHLYAAVVDVYHETLPELSRCQVLTDQRKKAIKRLAEYRVGGCGLGEDLENWRGYFATVRRDDWIMGRKVGKDGTPFKARLDHVLNPDTFVRITEARR